MTNQQLKAHCEDVIANPQDHLDCVVDMARVALASLEAEPVYQFIVNNPDHDGYVEWADCNPDYYSKEPSDSRRLLYTAPPAPELRLPDVSEGDPGKLHDVRTRHDFSNGFRFAIEEFKRLNAPHTAPIEPICATGGAEWVRLEDELPKDG